MIIPALTQWLDAIPHREPHLRSFFIARDEFWLEFANLVNAILRRRYLWANRLSSTQHNNLGRTSLGEKFDPVPVDEIFTDFFCAYVRVCSLLFLADAHQLARPRDEEVFSFPLLSEGHIRHLYTILRREKAVVFHLLHKEYAANTSTMNRQIHRAFLSAHGAQNLLRLTEEVFHRVPLPTQNEVAHFASRSLSVLGWSVASPATAGSKSLSTYCRGVLRFFQKYGNDLSNLESVSDSAVARDLILQHSALLLELCQWDTDVALELARKYLDLRDVQTPTTPSASASPSSASPSSSSPPPSSSSPSAKAEVVEETVRYDLDSYLQDTTFLPELVANAWKFKILRKYVIKGKMDLRVLSIATMDHALVDIWKEHNPGEVSGKNLVVQFLADFLLQGRLLEYIVSSDSHPQLISRSGNIVGFLIVTNRWSDSQADSVWNTIANNPDPRIVIATVTMLRAIINLMKTHGVLYLCRKMYEMPIDRYTFDILQVLRDLSTRISHSSPQFDYTKVDYKLRPWSVCVRLMRDTAPGRGTDKNLLGLHDEAGEQLKTLLPILPTEERHALYEECVRHIAERTTQATGSVRVIYVLATSQHSGDGLFFQQHEQLSRQILQEISALVNAERAVESYSYQTLVLRYRLELLAFMICRAGPAIPDDLYTEIWYNTVGPGALSNAARDIAWEQFLYTINTSPNNDFCEKLIGSYVPTMDPQFFTYGLFQFVANYKVPARQLHIATDKGEVLALETPKDDLIWLLMTESPSESTIGDRAARLLATRYAQLGRTGGVTLDEAEAAHVALADKCMEELRCASRKARSNPHCAQTSQIRCQRILVFQKLLLECIRQKPEFDRGRREDSKVDESDVPCGNAITIRYQYGNERQSVLMAPDHTLGDLYKRLCHAAGLTKINLFAKGQRLNTTSNTSQKIADSDFGGQLLIQRAEGAETTRPVLGSVAGTSVFETTLLRYSDELFELMESDDAVSQMMFDFLTFLPPRDTFIKAVIGGEAQSESLFPPGKSFQARYAAHALHSGLLEQIRGPNLNEVFLINAVHHLSAALLNQRLISDPISNFQELRLAAVLVHVLLEFLRGTPSFRTVSPISSSSITNLMRNNRTSFSRYFRCVLP